ncbi:acyl-CoA synthetase (AMP-forming)/AMP-acid ligase II [Trinickia symbiotica]|nr:AMP-binding protein [Trinickia symbiotica]PPK46407.1 acyl-CoA synthetase (AMP-forming)/AMP-acid ligase II [Trinickia symbiotica]
MRTRSPLIDGILGMLDATSAGAERAIVFVDESGAENAVQYRDLAQRALAVCSGLLALGARENDLVLIALPASIDYAGLLLGCVLAGMLPCTVPSPGKRFNADSIEVVEIACRLYAPRLLFTTDAASQPMRERLAGFGVRVVGTGELMLAGASGVLPQVCEKSLDDAHHVQLTSGSVSHPKAAVLSHRNVYDNLRGIGGAVGYDPSRGDATVSWLPLYHDMGLLTLLSNVHYRSALQFMQPSAFIRNPLGWLKRIAQARATTTAAPTFALRYCVRRFNAAAMQGIDLSCCRNIFVGAERVDARTMREFAQTFARYGLPGSALQPCYGMAESTLAVTMHDASRTLPAQALVHVVTDAIDSVTLAERQLALPDEARTESDDERAAPEKPAAQELVLSVGRSIPGMEYEVRDETGRVAAERQPGEIHIRGTSVMMGYMPSTQTEVPAGIDENGWFATGDIGYVVGEHLFILGRKKEIIIIRGANYFPHEIEEVIADHPAIFKGACAAVGVYDEKQGTESLVILVESHASGVHANANARAEMQTLLQRKLGYCAQEIVFVEPGALPRTTSGKLQRLKSRQLYLNGEFSDIRLPSPMAASAAMSAKSSPAPGDAIALELGPIPVRNESGAGNQASSLPHAGAHPDGHSNEQPL